jgi:RimJ/RimL family protein N-acetyltransferase
MGSVGFDRREVTMSTTIRTERLLLRPWQDSDREPFGAMNADPEVMRHFQGTRTPAESDEFVDRIIAHWAEHGWGLFALEVTAADDRATVPFIGFTGLWPADYVRPGMVEVGWRLMHSAWGHGYAPEAARASLRFGFEQVGLDEIVSFTVPQNANSQQVMQKIGLRREPAGDFNHPNVDRERFPELERHVFYRLPREKWEAARRLSEPSG